MTPQQPSLANRTLIDGIKLACQQVGITYQAYSDEWVIRLQKGGVSHLVYASSFDCNSQAAYAIATDKVATYQLLSASGLSAIPHFLLSSLAETKVDPNYLQKLFNDSPHLVIKPVLGGRGQCVAKFSSVATAQSFIEQHQSEVLAWAASPFIDVQRELRLVVFDGQLQIAYEKTDPPLVNGLKMFNLGLGAKAKALALPDVDSQLTETATAAMQALGLRLGAVDIVLDEQGTASILEINSRFSLEHFAATTPGNRQQAVDLYAKIVRRLFGAD